MELNNLLREVVERSASDLHLVPGMPPMLRINGALTPATAGTNGAALGRDSVEMLFDSVLTPSEKSALAQKQDVHRSLVANEPFQSERYGEAERFRACIFQERAGLCAALRVIPTNIPSLSLLFPPETEAFFRGLTALKRGLILVVGPTGSGKSTTTASLIDAINTERSERVYTLEDPIEYVHTSQLSLISQREIGSDVESFEQGGLSALRADPDVILFSELRTPDAVRIAVALAETGHLVFATLQANSVSEALRRMVEAFPESRETMQRMIARSLSAVVAQRLVPRANSKGRAAAHEILLVNAPVRRLIEAGETDVTPAIEAGREAGMQTLDDSLLSLYQAGTIAYETAQSLMTDAARLGPLPEQPTLPNSP